MRAQNAEEKEKEVGKLDIDLRHRHITAVTYWSTAARHIQGVIAISTRKRNLRWPAKIGFADCVRSPAAVLPLVYPFSDFVRR